MPRLSIIVEGWTESDWVDAILAPHLYRFGYSYVRPVLFNASGGVTRWAAERNDIIDELRNPRVHLVTTMVDYYGLPPTWPGRIRSKHLTDPLAKAQAIEEAVRRDIAGSFTDLDPRRFLPNVIMHEFEGLLFSDPGNLALGIGRRELAPVLTAIRDAFDTPEQINDSRQTKPEQRIKDLEPRYNKRLMGIAAFQHMGLDRVQQECPLFHRWMTALENFAANRP